MTQVDIFSVRASTYAACSSYLSSVISLLAFSTPYWLVSVNPDPEANFKNLGLWEACFRSFQDPNYLYDRDFRGCKWLFDEDYAFLSDLLAPPFFVATQTLFTIGFVFLLLAVVGVLAIQLCFMVEKEQYAMKALAGVMFVASIFCTTAVIIFGILGDNRDWMPDPEHNFLSWSFGLAVVGAFFQWVSAILFWVESRILTKKAAKRQANSFNMEPTTIKA